MRFESKEFMKAQRQWHESRRLNSSSENFGERRTTQCSMDSKRVATLKCCGSSDEDNATRHQCATSKEGFASESNDSRDDGNSLQRSQIQFPNQQYSGTPSDFSRKELEQLERLKLKVKKAEDAGDATVKLENAPTRPANNTNNDANESIHWGSIDAFLDTRAKGRRTHNGKGVDDLRALDGLLLAMLPTSVWFSDFLNESQGTINTIQKRMLIQYENNQ